MSAVTFRARANACMTSKPVALAMITGTDKRLFRYAPLEPAAMTASQRSVAMRSRMCRTASSNPRLIGSMVARSSNSSVMSRSKSNRREIDTVHMTGLSPVSRNGKKGWLMFQSISCFNNCSILKHEMKHKNQLFCGAFQRYTFNLLFLNKNIDFSSDFVVQERVVSQWHGDCSRVK